MQKSTMLPCTTTSLLNDAKRVREPLQQVAMQKLVESLLQQAQKHKFSLSIFFITQESGWYDLINMDVEQARKTARQLAEQLSAVLPESAVIGAYGNGHLAIACGLQSLDAGKLGAQLLDAGVMNFDDQQSAATRIVCNVGYLLYPEDTLTTDVNRLLATLQSIQPRGDQGARRVLQRARPPVRAKYRRRHWVDRELHAAIAEEERVKMYFQPRICNHSMRVVGAEALMRIHLPDGRILPPAEAIAHAEYSGQIIALTRLALRQAIACARHVRALGHQDLRISINVPSSLLQQQMILSHLVEAELLSCDDWQLLEFEISENLLPGTIKLPSVQHLLATLKSRGAWVSLDDFGTAHSSMAALDEFSWDLLKIDQRFIRDCHIHKKYQILDIIKQLSDVFQLQCVAEGVENYSEYNIVKKLQIDYTQGFFFQKAMPLSAFVDYIQRSMVRGAEHTELQPTDQLPS